MKKIKEKLKGYQVIDTHMHLGDTPNLNVASNTEDNIVLFLKDIGIKKAIFSHHSALSVLEYGTRKTFDSLKKFGDFLFTYLVFNPNFYEKNLALIKENINVQGVAGIKIHPSAHSCYPLDERYENFWKFVDKNNITVLTHTWNPNVPNKSQKYSDPFLFEKILQRHKNFNLILGHAGGRGDYLYRVINLLEKYENAYVDFSADIFEPGYIEAYINRVGSERLLYGSDMPWHDSRFLLSYILNLNIDEKHKQNILGLNASRLFKIPL